MISYQRDSRETIPACAVKIIGLGGAGTNMLERIALDSMEGAELLALNTDVRTLDSSLAKEKIQLGINITKGLGTGGDPLLGQQAMLEAEKTVRAALKGQRIVFLCAGPAPVRLLLLLASRARKERSSLSLQQCRFSLKATAGANRQRPR